MKHVVPREEFAPLHRLVTAAEIGDEPTRFLDQQQAGRDVPRLEIAFPIAIETARGDPGEIERGRAETADPRYIGADRTEDLAPLLEIAVPEEGRTGRDQRIGQVTARGHAQAAVMQPG